MRRTEIEQIKAKLQPKLLAQMNEHRNYRLPVELGMAEALSVVAYLQLALRHPGASAEPSADRIRWLKDQIIDRLEADGLNYVAEAARLGDNPDFD